MGEPQKYFPEIVEIHAVRRGRDGSDDEELQIAARVNAIRAHVPANAARSVMRKRWAFFAQDNWPGVIL